MLLYAADYTSLLEGALLTATSSAHFRRPRRRHLAEGRYGVLRSLQCYDRSEAGDSKKAACSPARFCGCGGKSGFGRADGVEEGGQGQVRLVEGACETEQSFVHTVRHLVRDHQE